MVENLRNIINVAYNNQIQAKPIKNLSNIISEEDPEDLFELLEQLGEGSFGQVFKALHKETGNIVAVKIIPVASDIDTLNKEIQILKKCKSPFIV
jgi:serine/threonine protein kinase